jgi:hypothetical protein
MSFSDYLKSPEMKFFAGSTAIVIIAIVISGAIQIDSQKSGSQVITVGPVWADAGWQCTSDEDFIVHTALRGIGGSQMALRVSGLGTQSLYELPSGQLVSFSIGADAGQSVTLIRDGTISGWITLETSDTAAATCISGNY